MNRSLRRFTTAALLSLFLVPVAARADDAAAQPSSEDMVIGVATAHFTEGVKAWRVNDVDHARHEWDTAIDAMLTSPVPVFQSEKLTATYRDLIDAVAEYERGADELGLKLPDQIYMPTENEFAKEFPDLAPEQRSDDLAFGLNPQVQAFLHYYTHGAGRTTIRQGILRSAAYRPLAEKIFKEEGVPIELVWLAQVESGWRSTAMSPAGALGVWQFIPATGQRFGLRQIGYVDERMDFAKSTRAAARYLHFLSGHYGGNWELAIGAYNCGEGNMDRAIARAGGVRDFWTLHRRGLLPNETQKYVPAVLAAIVVGTNPEKFQMY